MYILRLVLGKLKGGNWDLLIFVVIVMLIGIGK